MRDPHINRLPTLQSFACKLVSSMDTCYHLWYVASLKHHSPLCWFWQRCHRDYETKYDYWPVFCTLCPKISGTSVSDTSNSVCSSWISTKYRTLHYLNITYGHTHCDVRTLPFVLSVTSLWHQSLFTLRCVQCIVIDKGIKQQHTRLRLRACVEAKGGHFELKL